MLAILGFAGAAHASGVILYTCQSADGQVVVHAMPKKLKATVWQAKSTNGLAELACAAGTGRLLLTCSGDEGMTFEMNQNLTASIAVAGKVTDLACHASHQG